MEGKNNRFHSQANKKIDLSGIIMLNGRKKRPFSFIFDGVQLPRSCHLWFFPLIKCRSIFTCLVRSCWTVFFEMLIVSLLSYLSWLGRLDMKHISANILFNHKILVMPFVIPLNSVSALEVLQSSAFYPSRVLGSLPQTRSILMWTFNYLGCQPNPHMYMSRYQDVHSSWTRVHSQWCPLDSRRSLCLHPYDPLMADA